MEGNEEVDYDDNFPIHAGLDAFDNDTAMEESKMLQKMSPPTISGRHCAMHGKIVIVKRRG